MKLPLLVFVSVLVTLTSSRSSEKCRIELDNRLELNNAECYAILGDSLQVVSQDYTGWIPFSTIRVLYLDRPSRVVAGAGIGVIGGLVAGYLIGKNSDSNTDIVVTAFESFSSGTGNRKYTYGLAGGGIGLVVGGVVGAIIEEQTEFYFHKMSDNEKRELLKRLILSPGA